MRNRSIIIISLLVLSLIFGLGSFYFNKIVPVKQNIDMEQASLQAKRKLLDQYQSKKKQVPVQQTAVGNTVPNGLDLDSFLIDFSRLLKTYGVTLESMAVNDKQTTAERLPDHVSSKSYNITLLSANPQKMQAFLKAIEQLPRLVTIDTLELTSQPHHADATFDMTIYWGA